MSSVVSFALPAARNPVKPEFTRHDAHLNDGESTLKPQARASVVLPGEEIATATSFMRGHGTYPLNDKLQSSLAGVIERVNKLISVRPLRSRYSGEVGDVVVGRVTEVGQKRWKVDINARQDAVLLLSSINLPGGVQRRKSEMDELNMRKFFTDGDLLSAEVQSFFNDGGASLQTRNTKYGKLRNGTLVTVPSSLIRRSKSHFHTLSSGVHLIVGLNGNIWVSKATPQSTEEKDSEMIYMGTNDDDFSDDVRRNIARTCNSIIALARCQVLINEVLIFNMYEAALDLDVPVKDIVSRREEILSHARKARDFMHIDETQ
ncbi:exosome component 2 [Gonapodya prolifera JEL478]|uniref:Exosome component 2 n=1 Tax=Gonapodya prolifera (strain JEL478) TaxID=1344416 RepID=A0A139AVW8_GONPJ|nr:exosome component 2 [Gonapodya prolifera JEL478]|eukprot:KXS20878.1 exosome component 2 [Gonapodya prolifera JEL478]